MGWRGSSRRGDMKAIMRMMLATLVMTLVADAALSQANGNAADLDNVRAADIAWDKTYEAKDPNKAVAFCDEQASLLWPNYPVATGKDAIAKLTATALTIPDFKLVWQPDKIGVARSGDLGHTSGSYVWSFKDALGKSVSDKGKYLTVSKKQEYVQYRPASVASHGASAINSVRLEPRRLREPTIDVAIYKIWPEENYSGTSSHSTGEMNSS
jgi:ketosteroid isomerase-like protein